MSWQQRYRREVISGCKKELIKVESSSKRFWLLKHSRKSHTIQRVAVTNFRALDRHLNLGFPKSRPWDKRLVYNLFGRWLRGQILSACAVTFNVSFILLWEARRLHRSQSHISTQDTEEISNFLAFPMGKKKHIYPSNRSTDTSSWECRISNPTPNLLD